MQNRNRMAFDFLFFAGRGLKVRTRLYMVSPQQQTSAECSERLMEKSECEGARPDCEFSAEDASLICGMKKEVRRENDSSLTAALETVRRYSHQVAL